jgi:diguanylate cyclase (GGDEF)-like protein
LDGVEQRVIFQQFRWVAPVAITAALGAMVVTDRLAPVPAVLVSALVFGMTVILTSGVIGSADEQRPDGAVVIAAGHAIGLVALLTDGVPEAVAILISSIATAVGTVILIKHRLGSRPTITERETAILTSGLGLTFFVLFVEPGLEGTQGFAVGAIATIAMCAALFSAMFLMWVAGHDPATVSVPFVLIAAAQTALFASAMGNAIDGLFTEASAVIHLIGFGFAAAAVLHHQLAETFAPTVIRNSEVDARRSLVSFLVVLVGPILVGVNLVTDLDLSLPVLTVGSSMISLLVAGHLLQLVRHWVAVEHQGQHDPLTNLPNRPLFFDRLELAIDSARMREVRFATMFLDLDRFKAVNDTLGHDAGDELLRQVANRLHDASLRVGDDLTVSRLGGDEFAILIPQVKDERHSHAIGRLFLDQFLEPFDVGLRDIYVTPSIGIAQFPQDGDTVEELIENADTAMFEAKERGRNMVVSYSPEQRVPGAHRLEIEAALHRAIENGELQLFYQPQVDITTGRIFAVEALLRWLHPTLGQIGPDKFVPVAEESSLIDSIGQWTLNEACRTAARWARMGLPEINVAVNLSPRQFQKSVHLTNDVARALRDSGLEPSRLELELTESLALEKPEEVNATLSQFREMGIRTAIDDFGVGHTGLDYLDRISVDTLKIDRSFINRIGESGAPLVTAVISLARGLNLDVIAEGVETKAQVDFLKSHGCRYMQGYLFSKPLTAPQLERVLRNQLERSNVVEAPPAVPPIPRTGTAPS